MVPGGCGNANMVAFVVDQNEKGNEDRFDLVWEHFPLDTLRRTESFHGVGSSHPQCTETFATNKYSINNLLLVLDSST